MIYWMILGSFASGLVALGVYFYYQRQGQFENMEDVKYQILREDE